MLAARFTLRGNLQLAVTDITLAEVLAGPLRAGNEALAKRYRAVLESWHAHSLLLVGTLRILQSLYSSRP